VFRTRRPDIDLTLPSASFSASIRVVPSDLLVVTVSERVSVVVTRQRGSAATLAAVDRYECGYQLAGDQSVPIGDAVDDVEARGDALRAVDDDRGHRHLAGELNHLVAVGFVVAVKSPYAAQDGRTTRCIGVEQPLDDGAVNRHTVVQRGFGC